jgi:hypothetical protein
LLEGLGVELVHTRQSVDAVVEALRSVFRHDRVLVFCSASLAVPVHTFIA